MVVPLEEFVKKVFVRFTDLGRDKNGNVVLGLCSSLQPLDEKGNVKYEVYVSTRLLDTDVYNMGDILNIVMHEKLHLYCLDQFGIETDCNFIDYWIERLRDTTFKLSYVTSNNR